MTGNNMPSASGVRIAGDDYQWLHAWRVCMEALYDDLTKNSNNPTIAVGVEEPGVGNGDDVVRHRERPPHAYMQVKYATDRRISVGLPYLDREGVLKKLVAAHQKLTADGTPVEMRLVTNRANDPDDVLLRDRDGRDERDGRLLPRAAQGGPRSARGKARTAWATAADIDEATLLAFLNDFHFDLAYEVRHVRDVIGYLMTANGLRSDSTAVDSGAGWVARQVIAGHRRLTIADIKQAIIELELEAGSPWATVSVATIKHDQLADQATVSIDWVDRIAGANERDRVAPLPPSTWTDLATEISSVPSRLGSSRRILIGGHMRQATGFLLGIELRRIRGYEIAVRQLDQVWSSEVDSSDYELDVKEQPVDRGSDTALIVNVAANFAGDATDWILRSELPASKIVVATPVQGTGPKAVPTPIAANSLAIAIRDLARRQARTGTLHLILIGPLGLAALLGHYWNRMPTTFVYEHLGGQDYDKAFVVDV